LNKLKIFISFSLLQLLFVRNVVHEEYQL